jgi:amino-acid N-acetyltransferase
MRIALLKGRYRPKTAGISDPVKSLFLKGNFPLLQVVNNTTNSIRMRVSDYLAALVCTAPHIHSFTTVAPPVPPQLFTRQWQYGNPIRYPKTNPSRHYVTSSSDALSDPVVQNDTASSSSSFSGEKTFAGNWTDLEVNGNTTAAAQDPNISGDQLADGSNQKHATSVVPPLPETLDASGLLSLDPAVVDIVQIPPKIKDPDSDTEGNTPSSLEAMLKGLPFVNMFRGSANYIANHRNTIAVYHIPGTLLDFPDPNVFRDLMNDIALTWLLGMKIVLVVGCRFQIEKRVPHGQRLRFSGIPVTDAETLRIVKEEAGYVRFEVERQLARSLRMQGGNSYGAGKKEDHVDGNVVSGNFYSAQPFGVLNGVDYKYTGFVRKVEVEKIRQLHNSRDICLLTTLGVSPSGEVFNVNSESLAATVAGALGASKVIYLTEQEMELRHKVHGNKIQNLRFSDARHLLEYHNVTIHKKGFVTVGDMGNEDSPETSMLIKIGWAMTALDQGVKRAHIISPKFGSVLQELYTRDGSGALISRDLYEGIRKATYNDVSSIYDLIEPLIKMGTLVDRPKAVLEKDIDSYYVFTRDDHIVACGQLKIFEGADKRYAEIGCLVVNQEYRARGRGDAMLGYLERLCFLNGATTVFVLSTQTMEWFVERGFNHVTPNELPPSRPYDHKRGSQIYMKDINSSRDLDQNELWWNR